MSEPAQSLRKKWIEPVVAVLMALTTLCSYESNAVERRAALLDVQGSEALIVHASMFMQLLAAQHFGNEKLASSFLPSYECSPYACGLTNSPSVYFKTKPIHER